MSRSIAQLFRDMRAASAARTRYQHDADRLAAIAHEAQAEGYPGVAISYFRGSRIAQRAARAEYDGYRSGR